MSDNADSHNLLSVVATVHHQGVGQTLNDWAVCLSESLLGISAGGVGDVDWGTDLDVIAISKVVLAIVLVAICTPTLNRCFHQHSSINSANCPAIFHSIQIHLFHYALSPEFPRPRYRPSTSPSNRTGWCSLRQRDISDLDILITPLVEELNASNLIGNILWEDSVGLSRLLDLDRLRSLVVRHDCDYPFLGVCRKKVSRRWG